MKKFILASTSPRRRDLLSNIGLEFDVCSPNYDEHVETQDFSYDLIEMLARKKAESVLSSITEDAVIISADTIVTLDNKILGKPQSYDDAYSMLKLLSGKTHNVVTAICIIDAHSKQTIVGSDTSEVTFNKISEDDLKSYIRDFSPFDKAGSYGIQELPKNFIKEIKGEYDNIVGLPTIKLIEMLRTILNNN